jgi:signal peptidase I
MNTRATKLCLCLSLALLLGGCGPVGWVRYLGTHDFIKVPTEGMRPTINPGDLAAVDARRYTKHPVARFDAVTYKLPAENIPADVPSLTEKETYVGRVVGLGGETLEIRDGRLRIDGRVVDEQFQHFPTPADETFGPVVIPAGEYLLLGDNRPNSLDSRYWARPTLKKQYILGKVVEVFPQQ